MGSYLLNDVADYWRKVESGELPAPGPNEINVTARALDEAVSRIAGLLAELEASKCNAEYYKSAFEEQRDHADILEKRVAELEAKLTKRKAGYQKNTAHKQAMNVQLEKELQDMTASNRRHVAALELAQLRIAELEAERDAVPGTVFMWLIGEREAPTKVFSVANEAALRGETIVTLYKRLPAGFKVEGGE